MLDTYLKECLYFTANRLGRVLTKMAEDEFASCGLSPNGAFLLMAVYEQEGITQKRLGEMLHLQPSTVTRLIEKMIGRGLIYNQTEGRLSRIYSTDKGRSLEAQIERCWDSLRERYGALLGVEYGDRITLELYEASDKLEGKRES
ncbi:MarR family winged helix-turn-helix transcriptional regulator [Saccharibacillus alkalitolerans]|uniref:Winged helix-turn-helix transcriptional regulator n=1 Tax=Saccharibacillus alkalitolerans TaxID=2705290 RepID=A0ABX0FDN3_9BACL|nr:MarR family winged helix-turn-helix transcriptional regulator [Saccharibacillus alkalitolerans]NGZ76452.1 winged helix-turn-helix transcriptional regulator [Saccharibacillus alkalitolerans]